MIDLERLPQEIRKHVQDDIVKYGEWVTSHCLHMAPLSRMISELQDTDTDIIWLTVVLHVINVYSSKDPTPVHFVAARECLEGKAIADNHAVDLLARELVNYCLKLQKHVTASLSNKEQGWIDLHLSDDTGYFLPARDSLSNFVCEKDGSNFLDIIFAEFIQNIGQSGAKVASAILGSAQKRFSSYKSSGYQREHRPGAWSLWIKAGEGASVFSPFLSLLADTIWEDRVAGQFDKTQKQLPALTQSVSRPITRVLSSRAQVVMNNRTLAVTYEGKIVAEIPTIDPTLMPIIIKGSKRLNTIYHHKLLRFECKSGFDNWVQRRLDPRVLCFEGGETEIAEKLAFKAKEAPSIIKSLLFAQAHMNFYFDDGSNGNLIALRRFNSRKTHREDGIEIVMGTQLMPNYTFATDKRNRLLVPLPKLPPLVSSTNSHAGQALLQMLIMEEFTNKSIELVANESIEITEGQWQEFLKQSGLPESVFKQAITRWHSDGDDGGRFLVQVEQNRYSLGEEYCKELTFLKAQGRHRQKRQVEGRLSAKKRKRKGQRCL